MMASERSTVRQERDAHHAHQDHEVKDKLRRFRESLLRARTDPKEAERLERAYEKRLRQSVKMRRLS